VTERNLQDYISKIDGLSEVEVGHLREKYGSNDLARTERRSFFKEFIANFGDPIIKILMIALIVNVVLMVRDFNWYESAGIAVAILLSTFVSTLSEYGSESAFEKLQEDALKSKCRVIRQGGLKEIAVNETVVGDLILLQAGDRIPADGVILAGSVRVDQSPLNGESKEIEKRAADNEDIGFESPNAVFRGCIVCSGEAVMLVKKVGAETYYGKIAFEVQQDARESPLKMRLGALAKTISRFGYIGAALVAMADLFNSIVIVNGFNVAKIAQSIGTFKDIAEYGIHAATLAISVIVVAIPEGLPLMITVVLSSNMKRMLKDKVLVRRLVGIETSGNLNILFTDKTGTLTKGKPEVVSFIAGNTQLYENRYALAKSKLGELLKLSILCNTGASMIYEDGKAYAVGGNATERALSEFIDDRQPIHNIHIIDYLPFDSANKFSCAQVNGAMVCTLIKGAPEKILPHCLYYYDEKGEKKILGELRKLKLKMNQMTSRAVRLLAIAISEAPINRDGNFQDLTLVGIIGIRDDVRREAVQAVRGVMDAGVQVVMITGDNKDTALAIAREVGLVKEHQEDVVFSSEEINALSDAELKEILPHLRVVARALPTDKSRLIGIAQDLSMVAGMTGDGINDAPALKKADVGFAMGSGTEIAKEASDIIILDDNFLSISKAILYGRTIFKSIRKFIVFQLTINLCAVGISIIGPFIGIRSPITVLQMLWVNMVMDTLAGLAFAGEAPLKEYMEENPKRRDEPIINRYMFNQILVAGIYVTILCVLFLKLPVIRHMYDVGDGNEYFMTAFFAMFIFAGIFNSFNARTGRLILLANILKNKAFMIVMGFVAVVQLMIIYFGGAIFRTIGLTFAQLQFVIVLAFTVIPIDMIRKVLISGSRRGSAF